MGEERKGKENKEQRDIMSKFSHVVYKEVERRQPDSPPRATEGPAYEGVEAPEEDNTDPSTLDTQHPTLQSRAIVEPEATGSQSSRNSSFLSVPECSVSNISDEDLDLSCVFKKKKHILAIKYYFTQHTHY